ncbi:hypothetical protein [Allorhodopirellula solitaria]|uniref:Condensation domain protein n=1 Tax=Allorhodopirellula solitaria TaxID=2527987 RepID=A0A5C5XNY4_9BACT|nr:hypothetical protein [Allorhodopirellula solitaria]TWT64604.1 hypothetical protein CA85_37370 [Allorhodopirellula solitaria]
MALPLSQSFLPTTVMERYLARPSHGSGMVFSLTVVLKGNVEIESLREVWFEHLQEHPRMYAQLVGRGQGQRWERQERAREESFVYRTLAADVAAEVDDAECVRPRQGMGGRCVVQSLDQQNWSVRILFHHACCDGVGAIRLTGQIFHAYAQLCGGIVDRRLRPSGDRAPDTQDGSPSGSEVDGQPRRSEPSGYKVDRRLCPSGERAPDTQDGSSSGSEVDGQPRRSEPSGYKVDRRLCPSGERAPDTQDGSPSESEVDGQLRRSEPSGYKVDRRLRPSGERAPDTQDGSPSESEVDGQLRRSEPSGYKVDRRLCPSGERAPDTQDGSPSESEVDGQPRRSEPSGYKVDRRLRPSGERAPDTQGGSSSGSEVDGQPRRSEPSGYTALPDLRNLWATVRGSNARLPKRPVVGPSIESAGAHAAVLGADSTLASFQGQLRLMFSRSLSDRIRASLLARHVNLNDWAVAVTLHALATISDAAISPRRHVMIMNPVETRTWEQRHDTQNHIGIAFVRRTVGQLHRFSDTLASVSEQMQNVRRYGTAHEMASGIAIAERIPGCLSLMESWGTFTPTAALTSVAGLRLGKRFGVRRDGAALWVAGATLEDVFFEGPVQAGGQLSLTVWEFEGRIAISNRSPSGLLDTRAAERLLTRWAEIASQLPLEPCG